jgi:hypothetical protein
VNEAIKLAIEKGGYKNTEKWLPDERQRVYEYLCEQWAFIALDPLFWHALGKALGNKDVMMCDSPKCDTVQCEYGGYKSPKRMFDQYMDLKWYGGDEEKFWKELLTTRT